MPTPKLSIDRDALADFCRRHRISKLAFFGSVLRDDFRPDSDVDVLVEFEPGQVPGFIRLDGISEELAVLLGGREPDIVTYDSLNHRIRGPVLAEAEVQYAS